MIEVHEVRFKFHVNSSIAVEDVIGYKAGQNVVVNYSTVCRALEAKIAEVSPVLADKLKMVTIVILKKDNLNLVDTYLIDKETDEIKFPPDTNELVLGWQCILEVFEYGGGIEKTKKPDKKIVREAYESHKPFNSCERRILLAAKERLSVKTTAEIGIFIDEERTLSEDALVQDPMKVLQVFALALTANYSSFKMAQLIPKMEFSFEPVDEENEQVTEASGQKRHLPEVDKKNFALYFASLNENLAEGRNLVAARIRAFENHPLCETLEAILPRVYENLDGLSEFYTPTEDLSEQGRRLIINEIVARSAEVAHFNWSVEREVFTESQRGTLGWGPLDFYFEPEFLESRETTGEKETVKSDVQAPVMTNCNDLSEEGMDVESDEEGEESETAPELVEIEAKKKSEWQGLAQLGAQLYDLGKKKEKETGEKSFILRGILSTGRIWRFFSLHFAENMPKPTLHFDGQVPLRAIRTTKEGVKKAKRETKPKRSDKKKGGDKEIFDQGKTEKRPSGLFYHETKVDRKEVETVMKAFLGALLIPDPPITSH